MPHGLLDRRHGLSAAKAPSFYPALDALRAFAAVSVVVYHVIVIWKWETFPKRWPALWFYAGGLGVDLFFVISGFVIGLSVFSGIEAHGESAFRGSYIRRRLVRILPLYYLTLFAFLFVVSPGLMYVPDFAANLATHFLFLHNFSIDFHGAINGPNWSLAAEMQFYCLMLLLGPWCGRVAPWKLLLIPTAVALSWRAGAFAAFSADPAGPFVTFFWTTQLPAVLDKFAVGLFLARFVRSPTGKSALARLAGNGIAMICASAIAASLFYYVMRIFFWNGPYYWSCGPMVIAFPTLFAGVSGSLVFLACAVSLHLRSSWLTPVNYLGKISYGIYLWHLPVLMTLKAQAPPMPPLDVLLLALPATLVLASLSWHLFEEPLIRRFGKRAGVRLATG
jgi:peptidoglycan/LPS O-acetylase OafA/YrhL